jgi:hypothetical protein
VEEQSGAQANRAGADDQGGSIDSLHQKLPTAETPRRRECPRSAVVVLLRVSAPLR